MKNDTKRFIVTVLIFSTLLGSVGQLLFKIGLLSGSVDEAAFYIVAGVVAYGSSTVAYFYALGRSNLSWVYGFGGLSYVFASMLAFAVLGEPVTALRVGGIVSIAIGTALVGLS